MRPYSSIKDFVHRKADLLLIRSFARIRVVLEALGKKMNHLHFLSPNHLPFLLTGDCCSQCYWNLHLSRLAR